MNKLAEYVVDKITYAMLDEGVKSARRLYLDTGKIEQEEFDTLVNQDPTEKKKYIEWLISQYIKIGNQELLNSRYLLTRFDELAKKGLIDNTNIESYSFDSLADAVEALATKQSKSQTRLRLKRDIEIIMDDDKFLIISPKTVEAARYYGKGTKWCTAALRNNEFSEYMLSGIKIYYIIQKEGGGKYAVASAKDTGLIVYDSADDVVPTEVLGNVSIPVELFAPMTDKEYVMYMLVESGGWQNDDGSYSTKASIDIASKRLLAIPIEFDHVGGFFNCAFNNIVSLKNAPKTVGDFFDRSYNGLVSLENAPTKVNGEFDCSNNNLKSLKGIPAYINGDFSCNENKLTTLADGPQIIIGAVYADDNLVDEDELIASLPQNQIKLNKEEESILREAAKLCMT